MFYQHNILMVKITSTTNSKDRVTREFKFLTDICDGRDIKRLKSRFPVNTGILSFSIHVEDKKGILCIERSGFLTGEQIIATVSELGFRCKKL